MTERREPTISSYSPSKDDSQARAKSGSGANATGGRVGAPRTSARPPMVAQTVVVKSKLAPVALILALIASGVAGYAFWQLTEAQKFLVVADARIAELESKFEITDGEVATTTEAMTAKLQWADSEIRKLWGVAQDKNRKAIAANTSKVAGVVKTTAALKGTIDKKIQSAVKSINAELSIVGELVDSQQATLVSIEGQNKTIVGEAQAINDKMNSIDTSHKELERKVGSNEQAIEAIDAFRRNVNQQLMQLNGG